MSTGEAQPMKEDSEEEVDRDSPDTDQSTQSADSSDDGFESDDSSGTQICFDDSQFLLGDWYLQST